MSARPAAELAALATHVPGVVVRFATPADAALVLRFVHALAEYEQLTHEVDATEAHFRDYLGQAQPIIECLIAEYHGTPAGFALFYKTFSTFRGRPGLYLEDLFVYPEHRRCGLGSVLMKAVGRIALARGYVRYDWQVLDWNTPAIEFYEVLGARPLRQWIPFRLDGPALDALRAGDN